MIYRTPKNDLHQEADTLSKRALLWTYFVTVVTVVALALVAGRLNQTTESRLRPSGRFPERALRPQGNVQGVEQGLFGQRGVGQAVQRASARELERWRWVDRDRGLVAIPIERAMDAWLEQEARR